MFVSTIPLFQGKNVLVYFGPKKEINYLENLFLSLIERNNLVLWRSERCQLHAFKLGLDGSVKFQLRFHKVILNLNFLPVT